MSNLIFTLLIDPDTAATSCSLDEVLMGPICLSKKKVIDQGFGFGCQEGASPQTASLLCRSSV